MQKSSRLFYIFGTLFLTAFSLLFYLEQTKSMTIQSLDKKLLFVKMSSLTELALSTESYSQRHRTLSTLSNIYSKDGTLRENEISSFALSHSHILNWQSNSEK